MVASKSTVISKGPSLKEIKCLSKYPKINCYVSMACIFQEREVNRLWELRWKQKQFIPVWSRASYLIPPSDKDVLRVPIHSRMTIKIKWMSLQFLMMSLSQDNVG